MDQIFWDLSAFFVFPNNNIDDLKPENTVHKNSNIQNYQKRD